MSLKRHRHDFRDQDRGPKVTVLVTLAATRFDDGIALLRTGRPARYGGAIYIAGYGLECALKAKICVDQHLDKLPRKYWHHDLLRLAEATARWSSMSANRNLLDKFKTLAAEWDVGMRYEKVPLESRAVLDFIGRAKDVAKEFGTWQ